MLSSGFATVDSRLEDREDLLQVPSALARRFDKRPEVWLTLLCIDGVRQEDGYLDVALALRSDGARRVDGLLEMALTLRSDGSDSIVTCCSERFSILRPRLMGYSALTSSCKVFAVASSSSLELESE